MEALPADLFSDAEDRHALLALSLVPHIGAGRLRALIRQFGSAANALHAPARALAAVPGISADTARAIADLDADRVVADQQDRAARAGAWLLTEWDDRFPQPLREIYSPPVFLWVLGDVLPADAHAVAIVGTRKASAYGKRVAEYFAAGLAERGYTIVSGLAYGIDTAAHEAALAAGGRTIAILGSGVDAIYPAHNQALVRRIVAQGQGAVLSEFALGTKPLPSNFPARNRLIAGLAQGTLVAESGAKGGSLLTAMLALEQNREVFAVPVNLFTPTSEGTNRLIQQGQAKLVLTIDDVVTELNGHGTPAALTHAPVPATPPPDLNPIEQQLYASLTTEPVHIDTLCERGGFDTSTALVYLLSLEFKGLVRQMAGRQFFRV